MTIAGLVFATALAAAQSSGRSAAASQLTPGSAELIQPQELLKAIRSSVKPIVFYVGPRFLYAQARIPGADFIGPASDPQSLENLRKRVALLPKTSAIVLYCGCCPWDHCPNIRPAYNELQKRGFTNVKALYIAKSFGSDWVEKGYPVDQPSEPSGVR